MKRFLCAILTLLCLPVLCSCARQTEAKDTPEPEEVLILPESRTLAAFSDAETEQMLNRMCANRALIVGDALYCFEFDRDYRPVLARYSLTDGVLSDFQILAEECLPEYLAELDGRLYYINKGEIESLKTDGEDRRTLREGSCTGLQIREGLLYFSEENGRLSRMEPEGGGETVLMEAGCFYPWLSQGALLYQNGGDGERLHLRWLEDGADTALTDSAAYAPLILGQRLYYTGESALVRAGLDGLDAESFPLPGLRGAAELVPAGGDWLLRGVADENGLRQWTAPPEAPGSREYAAYEGYRLCDYAGGGWRVDVWYNTDGRIRCFVLVAPDGTETEYIAGQINGEETEKK